MNGSQEGKSNGLDMTQLDEDEFAKLKKFLYPERPLDPTDSEPVNADTSSCHTACYSVAEEGDECEGGSKHDDLQMVTKVDHHESQLSEAVKSRIAKIEEEVSVGQLRIRLLRLEELVSTAPSFDNLVHLEKQIETIRSTVQKSENQLQELIAQQIQNAQQELLNAVQATAAKACEEAITVTQPQGDTPANGLNIDDITRVLTPLWEEEGEQRKKSMELTMQRLDDVEGALAEINARCEEQCSALSEKLSEVQQNLAKECEERKAENKVQQAFLQEMNSGMRGILAKVGELDDKNQKASISLQQLTNDVDITGTQSSDILSPSVQTAVGTPAASSGIGLADASIACQHSHISSRTASHGSARMAPASPRTLTRVQPGLNTGPIQAMRIDNFPASNPSFSFLGGQHRSPSRERYPGRSAPASLVPPFVPGRAHCLSPGRGLSPSRALSPSQRGPSPGPAARGSLGDALVHFTSNRSASQERGWGPPNLTLMRSRDPSREDIRMWRDGLAPSSSSFTTSSSLPAHEKVHERVMPGQVDKAVLTGQAIPAQHVSPQQMMPGAQPRLQQPAPVPLPAQHGGAAQPKLAMPRGSSPVPAPRSSSSGPGNWQAIR